MRPPFFPRALPHRHPHTFPTRRSSDLQLSPGLLQDHPGQQGVAQGHEGQDDPRDIARIAQQGEAETAKQQTHGAPDSQPALAARKRAMAPRENRPTRAAMATRTTHTMESWARRNSRAVAKRVR